MTTNNTNHGDQSNIFNNSHHNKIIYYISTFPPELQAEMRAFFARFSDAKQLEFTQRDWRELEEWKNNYFKLEDEFAVYRNKNPDKKAERDKIDAAFKVGDLETVKQLLRQSLAGSKSSMAAESYQLGQVLNLEFNYQQALDCFETAHVLDKQNIDYLCEYALCLQRNKQHRLAIEKYEKLLDYYQKNNDKVKLVMTLNNLGLLYKDTQRHKEAEESYQEALGIRRELVEKNRACKQTE